LNDRRNDDRTRPDQRLNEFYGRNFYHDYDTARSQLGHLDRGSVAIITAISTQRLQVNAFRVFDWMKAFFAICQIDIARSEPGLRCSRLIAQSGGLWLYPFIGVHDRLTNR
jgi:hypothetical protein